MSAPFCEFCSSFGKLFSKVFDVEFGRPSCADVSLYAAFYVIDRKIGPAKHEQRTVMTVCFLSPMRRRLLLLAVIALLQPPPTSPTLLRDTLVDDESKADSSIGTAWSPSIARSFSSDPGPLLMPTQPTQGGRRGLLLTPTPVPTVVRDPDHELDFRGCSGRTSWVFDTSNGNHYFKTATNFELPSTWTIDTWVRPFTTGTEKNGTITTGAAVVASVAALAVPFRRRKVRWMKTIQFDRQAGTRGHEWRMGRERRLKGWFDRRTNRATTNFKPTLSSFAVCTPLPPFPAIPRSSRQSRKVAVISVRIFGREDFTSCLSCCWCSLQSRRRPGPNGT